MLARMDIISVNCPHTPATYHLLSARRLKLLRPEAYVVNTARGEVIDENALIRMIAAGELAGAGLDVFEHEPAVNPEAGASSRATGKVVLLPHMGSATRRGPHRHGREGHHQHQDLHGRPQAAGPRAAVDALSAAGDPRREPERVTAALTLCSDVARFVRIRLKCRDRAPGGFDARRCTLALASLALLPLLHSPAQSQALTGDAIKATFFTGKPFVANSPTRQRFTMVFTPGRQGDARAGRQARRRRSPAPGRS